MRAGVRPTWIAADSGTDRLENIKCGAPNYFYGFRTGLELYKSYP